jgi:hypothetical protein
MRKLALALLVIVALALMAGDNSSYVFQRGDKSYIHSRGSLENFVRISKRWDGDFIWYSRGGRAYLIRDAAVLAEARAAFRELDALEPAHERIAKQLQPLEEREQEIEEKLDAIADADEDEREIVDEATVRELEKKMRVVEGQMRKVEQEQEQLERKMEALEKVAEERLHQIVDKAIRKGVAKRVD